MPRQRHGCWARGRRYPGIEADAARAAVAVGVLTPAVHCRGLRLARRRTDDLIDLLADAVDEVRASETFKAYLDVQARYHRYS